MFRGLRGQIGVVVVCAALAGPAEAVHLTGRLLRVGYSGSGQNRATQGADHYRPGRWVPVVVELDNHDGDMFEGSVEVLQKDRDGDEVLAHQDVVFRGLKTYTLYIPGSAAPFGSRFTVRVFTKDRRLADVRGPSDERLSELVSANVAVPAPDNSIFVLDISQQPVNQLKLLAQDPLLIRELIVALCAPGDLPDHEAGLDMADVIVWDGADPSLLDIAQRTALIDWTRRGGTLVLGVGRNWDRLQQSRFAEIIPASLSGVASIAALPRGGANNRRTLSQLLFGKDESFDPPIPCATVTLDALLPGASPVIPDRPRPAEQVFVSRRPCVRGQVILVSAELHDLLRQGTQNTVFLRQVLQVRRKSASDDQEQQRGWSSGIPSNLFRFVDRMTGFQTTTSAYLLLAFLFVAAYVALATGGSWAWLKRKGLTQHSWNAFAAIAIAGSGVSLGAVQFIRGVGLKVEELTILDAQAGSPQAAGTVYLGLKAASHMLVDLRVPRDYRQMEEDSSADTSPTLRPLPAIPSFAGLDPTVYSAGQRYTVLAARGQLHAVPLRATLKQFEASWQGQLPGRLDAQLIRRTPDTSELREESWIRNGLGVELSDCYLLLAMRDLLEGLETRAHEVTVFRLSKLASGSTLTLAQWLDELTREEQRRRPNEQISRLRQVDLKERLHDFHSTWLGSGVGMTLDSYGNPREDVPVTRDLFQSIMLLFATFDEIDQRDLRRRNQALERSSGEWLDLSAQLGRGTAVFIGFSEAPSPVRLCYRRPYGSTPGRWFPIEPARSNVMYRFTIPIHDPDSVRAGAR